MKKIVLFLVLIFIISCDNKECPDERFIGQWKYSYTVEEENQSERHTHTYTFNQDNTFEYIYDYIKNTSSSSSYSSSTYNFEWTKEGSKYLRKNILSTYMDWEVFDIDYVDENNIIIMDRVFEKVY